MDKPAQNQDGNGLIPQKVIESISPKLQTVLVSLKKAIGPRLVRGVRPFFGVGDEVPYNIPSKELILRRVPHHVLFFATNYLIFIVLLSIIVILMHPFFIFVIMCITAGWWNVARLAGNDDAANPILLFGHPIASRERSIGMLVLTALSVYLFGGAVIFTIISTSGLCIAAHSVLRNYPVPEHDELGFLNELEYESIPNASAV